MRGGPVVVPEVCQGNRVKKWQRSFQWRKRRRFPLAHLKKNVLNALLFQDVQLKMKPIHNGLYKWELLPLIFVTPQSTENYVLQSWTPPSHLENVKKFPWQLNGWGSLYSRPCVLGSSRNMTNRHTMGWTVINTWAYYTELKKKTCCMLHHFWQKSI